MAANVHHLYHLSITHSQLAKESTGTYQYYGANGWVIG